ncbi:MAG TPA: putative metal-binding motif-containing protein [Polyangiaceae bacterium]|jgi:hypothetical protein
MLRRTCVAGLILAVSAGCGSKSGGFTPADGGVQEASLLSCGHADCDGDGYASPADCDDTNAMINPEAFDFAGDGVDNDCDGTVDDPVLTCETVPASAPGTPTDFARAADLCAQHSITNAGTVFDPLVHAAWGQVQGLGPGETLWTSATKPTQVAIATSMGQNQPRAGKTMVGLANGVWAVADPRSDPALDPAGFHINDACSDIPLVAEDCASLSDGTPSGDVSVQDWAELDLTVKVPSNVQAVTFDFSFLSSEFNQWWQSAANDAFFVLVTSDELQGENVAKGADGLAVTINSSFFQLCPAPPGPPGLSADKSAALTSCVGLAGDPSQSIFGALAGTGYDGAATSSNDTATAVNGNLYVYGGGSGWLNAKFPVTPSETIVMRVIVADAFDGLKDSAVLFDAMGWEPTSQTGVGRPPVNQ